MPFNVNDCIRIHIAGYPADKGYILQIMPNSVYRVLMEERGPGSYMRTDFILYLTEGQMVLSTA
jgi:hypothetical protein